MRPTQWLPTLLAVALTVSCAPSSQGSTNKSKHGPLWSSAPSMTEGRVGHTATKLADGRVLVAGGFKPGVGSLTSAEIYDPTTNTWSAAGNMQQARHFHAAVMTNNGKLLVAGGSQTGSTGTILLSSTEYFDMATNTWSSGPAMSEARDNLTATYSDATFSAYLVGGRNTLASCHVTQCLIGSELVEIIDKYEHISTATPLNQARANHWAAILNGQDLYVFGGITQPGTALESVEKYNTSLNTWQIMANMPSARSSFAGVELLGGRILIGGGQKSNQSSSADCEIYDTNADTWFNAGPMMTPRYPVYFAPTPSGRVLAVGGSLQGEVYNPTTDVWTPVASNVSNFKPMSATLLDTGLILIAGGVAGSAAVGLSELFRETNWYADSSLSPTRYGHQVVKLLDGRILEIGGHHEAIGFVTSVQIYDPSTGQWRATTPMSQARGYFSATVLTDGSVLVAGGEQGGFGDVYTNSVEVFDPSSETWTSANALPHTRGAHQAVLLPSGQVLIAGGLSDTWTSQSTSLLYSPNSGTWSTTGPVSVPRVGGTITLHPNGSAYLIGGYDLTNNAATASVERFSGGAWTTLGSLVEARHSHSTQLLPSGLILVAGGDYGYSSVPRLTAELYDVSGSGSASLTGALSEGRSTAAIAPLGGAAIIAGGFNQTGWVYAAEIYDVASGTWSVTLPATYGRSQAIAVQLSNNSVMVVGGTTSVPGAPNEIFE